MSNSYSAQQIALLIARACERGSKKRALLPDAVPVQLGASERIARSRLPGLEVIHEHFARDLRRNLSALLGCPCSASLAGLQVHKFGDFLKTLKHPSSIHIFRLPPLSGQALLVIPPQGASAIIERMLGGRGGLPSTGRARELSGIENRLLGKTALLALDDLKGCWSAAAPVDVVYVRAEQNPLAAAVVPAAENAAVVELNIGISGAHSVWHICLPLSLLAPVRDKISSPWQQPAKSGDTDTAWRMEAGIMKASAELIARLGSGKIMVRDLLQLKKGDVIALDAGPEGEAEILVEGRAKFKGAPGELRGRKCIMIRKN